MSAQAPSAVILVRAERFLPNPATAADNAFQRDVPAGESDEAISARAMAEMDALSAALDWLERKSTKRDRDNLQRFAITANEPFGVSMANLRVLAKRLGRDHALAADRHRWHWCGARQRAPLWGRDTRGGYRWMR